MADSCADMNSNYYLCITVFRAPALSTGHNIAFGWRAACHVLKMLYYLWSACSKFIKNHCYAGINIKRGRHCLLTTFERPAWGHNPKPSHMSWCPKNCPVNFLFEKLKISWIVYASTYVDFLKRVVSSHIWEMKYLCCSVTKSMTQKW
jgi:hypothetical protein